MATLNKGWVGYDIITLIKGLLCLILKTIIITYLVSVSPHSPLTSFMATVAMSNPETAPTTGDRVFCICVVMAPAVLVLLMLGGALYACGVTPNPDLPQIQITSSASVSNFNSSSSLLTATWNLQFSIQNPNNEISIVLECLEGSVYYQGEPLADVWIPDFRLGGRNEIEVKAMFSKLKGSVHDEPSLDYVVRERVTHGLANFNVWMWGEVRPSSTFGVKHWVKVICENLIFQFSSSRVGGTLLGGNKDCVVLNY